ncbi:MAG: HAMP domain-containing sensor histidine kinase [Luteolibacter sp.]
MTNLLLNTDLALDDVDAADDRMRRRLGLIREETGRLSRIVDNVLAFARLERDPAKLLPSLCDADRVVEEVRENFAPLFARKSIHCEFEGSFGEEVDLDRDAFAQILSNLLSNVEKYAGEQARAKVSISSNTTAWMIEVSDDGPGIPLEARERIFQPFERVVSSAREGVSGTGLGLAISRELAERMGGRLELVDSERGALFRLQIPRTEKRAA